VLSFEFGLRQAASLFNNQGVRIGDICSVVLSFNLLPDMCYLPSSAQLPDMLLLLPQ
jgi:hypothetical protein